MHELSGKQVCVSANGLKQLGGQPAWKRGSSSSSMARTSVGKMNLVIVGDVLAAKDTGNRPQHRLEMEFGIGCQVGSINAAC